MVETAGGLDNESPRFSTLVSIHCARILIFLAFLQMWNKSINMAPNDLITSHVFFVSSSRLSSLIWPRWVRIIPARCNVDAICETVDLRTPSMSLRNSYHCRSYHLFVEANDTNDQRRRAE